MIPLASAAIRVAHLATNAPPDTVWVQAPPSGWFDAVTHVAGGLLILILLVVIVGLTPAALRFRKAYARLTAQFEKLQADMAPLIRNAASIADNVNHVSTWVRDDAGRIHDTLVGANARLQEAVALTERRMHDFSALLDVVQQEAEGLFVSTAATVRGVRTGASRFGGGDGPELASVEVDDDGLEAAVDDEDIDYGNDSNSIDQRANGDADDNADAPRAPRIIRRTRSGR